MNSIGPAILTACINIALALVLAPLFEGVMRKITAVVQSRKGPPLTQPYMDLAKLLIKEDIEVGHVPALQRLSALLAPAAVLAVALFLPISGHAPLAGGADAVILNGRDPEAGQREEARLAALWPGTAFRFIARAAGRLRI